ncbi:dTMP kinase, partial [Proteus mirabilis]
ERYQALAKEDASIITIDASQDIDKVQADIRDVLNQWLTQENSAL